MGKSIKFREYQVWQTFVVRAVDSRGRFRLAVVVCASDWRRFFELDSLCEERNDAIVDFVESIYEDTPWYHVPLEIRVEEKGLGDAIVDSWFLREVEVEYGIDTMRKMRAQNTWRKHCQENPNQFRDSTTQKALAES